MELSTELCVEIETSVANECGEILDAIAKPDGIWNLSVVGSVGSTNTTEAFVDYLPVDGRCQFVGKFTFCASQINAMQQEERTFYLTTKIEDAVTNIKDRVQNGAA